MNLMNLIGLKNQLNQVNLRPIFETPQPTAIAAIMGGVIMTNEQKKRTEQWDF